MNASTPQIPQPPPRLAQLRCVNHGDREAAARCPGCQRYYCRECVSPFDHRLLCAQCIREAAREETPEPKRRLYFPAAPFQLVAGLVLLWIIFYAAGSALLSIPTSFQRKYNALSERYYDSGEGAWDVEGEP